MPWWWLHLEGMATSRGVRRENASTSIHDDSVCSHQSRRRTGISWNGGHRGVFDAGLIGELSVGPADRSPFRNGCAARQHSEELATHRSEPEKLLCLYWRYPGFQHRNQPPAPKKIQEQSARSFVSVDIVARRRTSASNGWRCS